MCLNNTTCLPNVNYLKCLRFFVRLFEIFEVPVSDGCEYSDVPDMTPYRRMSGYRGFGGV